jgi:hypothetical protein
MRDYVDGVNKTWWRNYNAGASQEKQETRARNSFDKVDSGVYRVISRRSCCKIKIRWGLEAVTITRQRDDDTPSQKRAKKGSGGPRVVGSAFWTIGGRTTGEAREGERQEKLQRAHDFQVRRTAVLKPIVTVASLVSTKQDQRD